MQSPTPSFGFGKDHGANMKDVADIAAGSSLITVWVGWLPEVSLVIAILWGLIRIYEWFRFRVLGKRDDLVGVTEEQQ